MANRTETLLLQVVERGSLAGLTPVEEVVVERREYEPDFMLEDRVKRAYLVEVGQKVRHMPVMRKKLAGRDWCIDCTLV